MLMPHGPLHVRGEREGLLPKLMSTPAYSGWALRIVGQSLGAAVASLLTLRLRKLYPHIHCFAYNPLPVVDENVVEAVGVETCKSLVTQITCNQGMPEPSRLVCWRKSALVS